MGIMNRIKKRLPVLGAGGDGAVRTPEPPPPATPTWDGEEPKSPRGDRPVADFIDELVKSNEIVIFMKGTPESPMCGFSANAASILMSYGKPIAHFDVLSDPEVREGVKEYSQWPTLPQIYVGGEFLGGSDILSQMHQSGELRELIDAAFAKGAKG